MSQQVDVARVLQFSANVWMLAQQHGSRLRSSVRTEMQKGKAAFYDRIGAVTAVKKTSRHADTPQLDTPHSRRMVTMDDYEYADLIDNQDKLRMIHDPQSEYAQAAAWALGRAMDDTLIAAALGIAYAGESGATTVSLANTQKVQALNGAVAGNMTLDAMRAAKFMLDAQDVDPSIPRYMAINASALQALLGITQVTSHDYNSVKALVQGELDTYLGFKIIRTERLITTPNAFTYDTVTGLFNGGGSTTSLPNSKSMIAWAGDGLLLSMGEDIKSRIDERSDKSYATQVYASASFGGTRMEDVKVVEIICKQS